MTNSSTIHTSPELTVLSIDGVPFDLAGQLCRQGNMPNLARLIGQVGIQKMRSVQPTVSCVAWTSYMTGKNPGKHGTYGFIDRRPDTYDIELPNAATMAAENIWEILSHAGKRVFGMNVPGTYPPRKVNGILIGGFLSPSIEKVAFPTEVGDYLRSIDYRIDSDPVLARQDKRAMLDDLNTTLEKRLQAMFHFLDTEKWDFFHTHIMGTDRINHFLLHAMHQDDSEFTPAFIAYYQRIDDAIGRLLERLGDDAAILILSDHGFCPIKQEVQLSRYLVETGWTTPAAEVRHPLSIDPANSSAYCLIPGRIFVNLAGREPRGIVPLEQYQQTREQLRDDLLKLKDPDTGDPVIAKVIMREDLYWPTGQSQPHKTTPEQAALTGGVFGRAADMIAVPHDGYDLKLGLAGDRVFVKTQLEGMHTYDDALAVARGIELPQSNLEIMTLAPAILQRLGVDIPPDMDTQGTANA